MLTVILPSGLAIEPPAGPMLLVVAAPIGSPTEVAADMATVSPEGARKTKAVTIATTTTIAAAPTINTPMVINIAFLDIVFMNQISLKQTDSNISRKERIFELSGDVCFRTITFLPHLGKALC